MYGTDRRHDVKRNFRWCNNVASNAMKKDKRTNIRSVALSGYEEQIGWYGKLDRTAIFHETPTNESNLVTPLRTQTAPLKVMAVMYSTENGTEQR